MSEKLEIDVIANDLASAAITAIKSAFTDMGGTMGAVGAIGVTALAAVAAATMKAVNEAQSYDQSIKDMMLATGGTAEETSRLVQVVDDAGISYEVLQTAMKMAAKNGIEPNVESLARLSDQYLALAPGMERDQFLLENFGRSGMNMARVMELGSQKIGEMNNAVDSSLIVTDKAIAESEEYRMNLDKLDDAWHGLLVTVGNEVIPVINDSIPVIEKSSEAIKDQVKAWEYLIPPIAGAHAAYIEISKILDSNKAKQYEAQDAINAHADALNDAAPSFDNYDQKMKQATADLNEMTAANKELLGLTMSLQNENNNYAENMDKARANLAALGVELNAAIPKYGANSEKVADLKGKFDEAAEAVRQLDAEHQKAMMTIAYNLLVAKLQADGFTDAEFQMAMQAGVSMGQIDQKTAQMAVSMNNAANAALKTNDVTTFTNALPGIIGVEAAAKNSAKGLDGVSTSANSASGALEKGATSADTMNEGISKISTTADQKIKEAQKSFDSFTSAKMVGQVQAVTAALNAIPTDINVNITQTTSNTTVPGTPGSGAGSGAARGVNPGATSNPTNPNNGGAASSNIFYGNVTYMLDPVETKQLLMQQVP